MKKNNNCKLNSKFEVLMLTAPILLVGVYAIIQEIMLIMWHSWSKSLRLGVSWGLNHP